MSITAAFFSWSVVWMRYQLSSETLLNQIPRVSILHLNNSRIIIPSCRTTCSKQEAYSNRKSEWSNVARPWSTPARSPQVPNRLPQVTVPSSSDNSRLKTQPVLLDSIGNRDTTETCSRHSSLLPEENIFAHWYLQATQDSPGKCHKISVSTIKIGTHYSTHFQPSTCRIELS